MLTFNHERTAVIQRAEYEPPRVLLTQSNLVGDGSCYQGLQAFTCDYGTAAVTT